MGSAGADGPAPGHARHPELDVLCGRDRAVLERNSGLLNVCREGSE